MHCEADSYLSGIRWQMFAGDSLATGGLSSLADDSIDVGIHDPPYDEHTHNKSRRGRSLDYVDKENPGGSASIKRNRHLGFAPLTKEQMHEIANQSARLVKRWSLFFCSVEMVSDWKAAGEAAGLEYVRTCFWHKLGGSPQFTGDRPAVACEAIVCLHRPGKKRWNGGGKQGLYSFPIVLNRSAKVRCHTTQKPVELMDALIRDFTDPHDVVLDAFAGSGTTGVSCGRLFREFIGFELLDGTIPVEVPIEGKKKETRTEFPNYFETACRRLRGEAAVVNPAQLDFLLTTGAA